MRRLVALLGALAFLLVLPCNASAASHAWTLPLADFLGIGKALLGGLEFTASFFRDLFLALFGGLADMLIPDSWARKGTELLTWIAAVPNFNRSAFGDLRVLNQMSLWIGLAMLPVTLGISVFLPSLGVTSAADTPGAVLGRTLAAGAGVALWTTLWGQGAALCNTLSAAYVQSSLAADGMNAYMELIAVGGMVGGIPFLGILIVLAASIVFLTGLVLKVFLVLIGAVLFASGPLLLGLVPTQRGARLARTWLTALLVTWAVPVAWGLILVVSGILINDAPAIGVAIGGRGSIASTGGMLVAGCAAIAGPMLCISLTRSLLGPIGSQFSSALSAVAPSRVTQRLSSAPAAVAGRAGRVGGAARDVRSSAGRSSDEARDGLAREQRRAWQAGRPNGSSASAVSYGPARPAGLSTPAVATGTAWRATASPGHRRGRLDDSSPVRGGDSPEGQAAGAPRSGGGGAPPPSTPQESEGSAQTWPETHMRDRQPHLRASRAEAVQATPAVGRTRRAGASGAAANTGRGPGGGAPASPRRTPRSVEPPNPATPPAAPSRAATTHPVPESQPPTPSHRRRRNDDTTDRTESP